MPGRNIRKVDVADSYYHVYARGVNKQRIFLDPADYTYFLALLKRYLSRSDTTTARGVVFPKLYQDIELLAFCLMQNHFHLLVYQINEEGMVKLMRRIMTSYSGYFNRKYERTGPLFESRYRASRVDNESYLLHISRYIHLNPADWQNYNYSSLRSYLGAAAQDWLVIERITNLFTSRSDYLQFLESYEQNKAELDIIKHVLANES